MTNVGEPSLHQTVPEGPDTVQPQMWCIWGAGLIGYTLACVLAERGYRCTLIDIRRDRVERVNQRLCPFAHLPAGFTVPTPEVLERIAAVTFEDAAGLSQYRRHVISVPTEREGIPDFRSLEAVCRRLASFPVPEQPYYIVIESTICPSWIDSIVHPCFAKAGFQRGLHYAIGCSPRRDVFYDAAHTISNVTKVIGGESQDIVDEMKTLYSRVGCEVVVAPDERYAALTKPIENLFRHTSILLANQLAAAMPEWNMRELLRLVGTKWNVDTYHPSIGIGGYCVPLASGYILPLVTDDSSASFKMSDQKEEHFARQLLAKVRRHLADRRVGVLGVAYAPDLKVHVRSPTQRLLRYVWEVNGSPQVHDPLYDASELAEVTRAPGFRFPEDLARFDTVVLMTPHTAYAAITDEHLNAHLRPDTVVLDNSGKWRGRRFRDGVMYCELGS